MADSIDVTYHGDVRFPLKTDPLRIGGLPELPLGEPVEITEEYINREISQHDVVAWATFLFDEEHGLYNVALPAPRVTFQLHEEAAAEEPQPLKEAADLFRQLDEAPVKEQDAQPAEDVS